MISYVAAGAVGVAGAMLGYSKPVTLLAVLAATLPIEAINYLMQRRHRDEA
jgi:hypothetical protein